MRSPASILTPDAPSFCVAPHPPSLRSLPSDYHIAISLFGVSIAGSPFYLQVAGPTPTPTLALSPQTLLARQRPCGLWHSMPTPLSSLRPAQATCASDPRMRAESPRDCASVPGSLRVPCPPPPPPTHTHRQVAGPGAYSPNCEVSGNALYTIHARTTHSFEVRFRDKNHNVAQAVDLDVYVVPQPEALATDGDAAGGGGGGAGMPSAWDLATRPASNVSNEEANDAAVLQRGGGKGAKAAAAAAKQWRDKASKGSAGAAAARQQPQAAPEPVAADSGGEGSGAMDDGEGSADEATHREVSGREMDGVVTKQRPLQIQVCARRITPHRDDIAVQSVQSVQSVHCMSRRV